MNTENISSTAATIGGGFIGGLLIGYALKKIVRIAAIVVGLFFAGLTYLQYQQIIAINWNKIPHLSHNVVTTLTNATNQISLNSGHPPDIATSNFGISIPMTGSMFVGFAIGFMKCK